MCLLFLFVSCNPSIEVSRQTDEDIIIIPDYKDVTIPHNIAPLNFQVASELELALLVKGDDGTELCLYANKGLFDFPLKKWKTLLASNQGKDLTLTVCKREKDGWTAYKPFTMHIAEDIIDPYLAYRLVQPTYTFWNEMGIYQRNMETFDQTPIFENKFTEYNCVNCHSFPNRDANSMLLHMRAKNAGTLLVHDDTIEKLNTTTDQTISALVYPYWHPSEKYMAFSVNATLQAFFYHTPNVIEVFDNASDVVIYDVEKHEIFSSPLLKSEDAFETFPTFSPDGKSLYFCSAQKVDTLPYTWKDVHYSLCRIDIDVEHRTFGTIVDTLYNARLNGGSISFPRVSPDGRFLVATLHDAGNFSIWHPEADLCLFDLSTGTTCIMEEANSPAATDSYHSWSSNSRWLVFSSRRLDGLYTRPFITYIDAEGNVHKPFLLPQKRALSYYDDLFFSFNIPELIQDKVQFRQQEISHIMKDSEGVNVTYN